MLEHSSWEISMQIKLQSNAHSKFVIRLSEITDSFGLHQLVKDITRDNPDSILDLVYTTHPDQITDAAAAEKLATSDHYMVTFSSKILTKKIVNPPRKVYQYAKADSVFLNDLILKTDWDSIIIENDVEGTWNAFVETFFAVSMQRYLVLQHVPNQSHGLLLTLRNLFLKKHKAFKRARASDNNLLWEKYKSLRNKVKYAVKKSYQDHWYNLVNRNDNMKKNWSFVKSTRSQPENLSFNINNQQCTDPAKIVQECNDLFASFFTHNDHTVELEVQNICIMSFSSDMVLDRI